MVLPHSTHLNSPAVKVNSNKVWSNGESQTLLSPFLTSLPRKCS